ARQRGVGLRAVPCTIPRKAGAAMLLEALLKVVPRRPGAGFEAVEYRWEGSQGIYCFQGGVAHEAVLTLEKGPVLVPRERPEPALRDRVPVYPPLCPRIIEAVAI